MAEGFYLLSHLASFDHSFCDAPSASMLRILIKLGIANVHQRCPFCCICVSVDTPDVYRGTVLGEAGHLLAAVYPDLISGTCDLNKCPHRALGAADQPGLVSGGGQCRGPTCCVCIYVPTDPKRNYSKSSLAPPLEVPTTYRQTDQALYLKNFLKKKKRLGIFFFPSKIKVAWRQGQADVYCWRPAWSPC